MSSGNLNFFTRSDPGRLTVKEEKRNARSNVANEPRAYSQLAGGVSPPIARSGRRAKVRAAAHCPGPDPVGLRAGAPSPVKPGGWSRPDFRSVCIPSQGCPAAHPQRYAC